MLVFFKMNDPYLSGRNVMENADSSSVTGGGCRFITGKWSVYFEEALSEPSQTSHLRRSILQK